MVSGDGSQRGRNRQRRLRAFYPRCQVLLNEDTRQDSVPAGKKVSLLDG